MVRAFLCNLGRQDPFIDQQGIPADVIRGASSGIAMLSALLRRSWNEPFPLAARFRFWLGFRRLLDFFLAFVFASHGSQCDIKGFIAAKMKSRIR